MEHAQDSILHGTYIQISRMILAEHKYQDVWEQSRMTMSAVLGGPLRGVISWARDGGHYRGGGDADRLVTLVEQHLQVCQI